MIIRYGSTDVVITPPKLGYETLIRLPFTITKLSGGNGYSIWDNGTNYDVRLCRCEWLLSEAETDTLLGIINDPAKGRGNDLTLKLGTTSGFYPFGPDKGDSGDFIVRLLSVDPKASRGHPGDHFDTACEFVMAGSYPVFSIPAADNEGSLQIGTVTGLRYPQDMHTQGRVYGVKSNITGGGSVYTNDRTSTADENECNLDLTQTAANAGRLIDHLVGTVRSSAVDVIAPANSYMFGRENGSTATYSCQWPQNEINVTHRQFNQFDLSIKLRRISG